MKWLRERSAEPSTWAGAGLLIMGLGQVAGVDTSAAGQAVAEAAPQLASGDYAGAGGMLLAGLLSVVLGERRR